MTDAKQPAQFDWATELSDAQGHVTLSAQEAKEIGARLRTGYEAARLDIESLRAQLAAQQPGAAYAALPEPITYQIAVLKACEHGDALVGWRVEPSRQSFDASMRPKRKLYTEGNMHDFADRTHALRASHGQAPAQAATLRWNPMENGNFETALQMAAVISHRDAQPAPASVVGPSADLVTRDSAMQAIEHVAIHNSETREREAYRMLAQFVNNVRGKP